MDNGTYEMDGYVYTVSNITTDHALVVSYSQTQKAFIKIIGSWVRSDTLHVK